MSSEEMLNVVSGFCLIAGSLTALTGGLGIVRLPSFYSRLHGGGVTDTLGAGLVLLGLMLQSGWTLPTAKLVMILTFLLITSPAACHALAHAAIVHGLDPRGGGKAADREAPEK